jgi:hypothetical protein
MYGFVYLTQVVCFVHMSNVGTSSSRPSVAEVEAGLSVLAGHVTLARNCSTYLVTWLIRAQ